MIRRRAVLLAAPLLATLIGGQVLVAPPIEAQTAAPYCTSGEAPRFVHGIAALKDRLGEIMGSPLECEHVDPASGDTHQRTTTGLAYYRPSINTAIFTDGSAHWALADGTVVMWRNTSITPPQPTEAETAYLQRTAALRSRSVTLQRRLTSVRQQAERGQLDSIDPASLRSLVDDFQATRDAYAAERAPRRLGRYHGMMVTSLNTGMGAAELLAQARQIDTPAVRDSLISSAVQHRQESERLQRAATDAYSRALPIVVD